MPSSTAWRRPPGATGVRFQSPTRPGCDAIERLSPEPFTYRGTSKRVNYLNSYNSGDGLGLFLGPENNLGADYASSQRFRLDKTKELHGDYDPTSRDSYHSSLNGDISHDRYRSQSRKEGEDSRGRSRGHQRSGSNIDTLADVALATSPTFTNGSPHTPHTSWSARPNTNSFDHGWQERPAKRARSEKMPSPEWLRRDSRPATSYDSTQRNISHADAELLLNLAHPRMLAPLQTPRSYQYIHRSPSYTRLSASTTTSEEAQISPGEPGGLLKSPIELNGHTELEENVFAHTNVTKSPGRAVGYMLNVAEGHDLKPIEQNQDADPPMSHIPGEAEMKAKEEPLITDEHHSIFREVTEDQWGMDEAGSQRLESPTPKKARRVKPTTEATSCTGCHLLQSNDPTASDEASTFWISCNGCKKWYHSACAGFKDKKEAQSVDKYICPKCEAVHGSTTYVRKSSRARTAIDYAGLNEGVVKASTDTPGHHYIQPIKEGTIMFAPDDFARIRPEYVTLEYFEMTDGMKRPVVIPASWNPRWGVQQFGEAATDGLQEYAETVDPVTGGTAPPLGEWNPAQEEVLDCYQDLLEMVMPRDLTVRKVSELYGPEERLDVIEVKSQQQGEKNWNMRRWADYYESTGEKIIRNVISLEVSHTRLGRLIRRPKIVRDLDLQDSVWPLESQYGVDFPKVQFYCLMSVADCYTDFHIDFGGSSVYYHILKGKKTFFFIPPEDKNLKLYQDWCNSDTQDSTFLGDLTGDCSRVDLSEGDTMLIPAGWIHSVWTPEDSLVIGGNFLTRQNYAMQIKIANVERDTKVARKFRYPHFQKIMWFTAINYLEDDPVPQEVLEDFQSDPEYSFLRAQPIWHEFGDLVNNIEPGSDRFNARFYSKSEIEGLPALRDYLYRTALIAGGVHVPGVTPDTVRNVKRSIPKGAGDPLDTMKTFGVWCAWKIGNVLAPEWTSRDALTTTQLAEKFENPKQSEPSRIPPERASTRVASLSEHARAAQEAKTATPKRSMSSGTYDSDENKKPTSAPKTSGLGPKRVACDACRKRRIRCRHKEESDGTNPQSPDLPRARTSSNLSTNGTRPDMMQIDPSLRESSTAASAYPDIINDEVPASVVAQDAFANISAQQGEGSVDGSGLGATNKKGRSKACDECRKSKRRCIHDELGRVDPAKAAEPSKPRGSTNIKRPARLSDDHQTSAAKRPKLETGNGDTDTDTENLLVGQAQSALAAEGQEGANGNFDTSLIDPALMAASTPAPAPVASSQQSSPPLLGDAIEKMKAATMAMNQYTQGVASASASRQTSSQTAPPTQVDPVSTSTVIVQADIASEPGPAPAQTQVSTQEATVNQTGQLAVSTQTSAGSLASPPESLLDNADYSPAVLTEMEQDKTTIETNGGGSELSINALETPDSFSRHSSQQPKQVDRNVVEVSLATQNPLTETASYGRRESSSAASALTSEAPMSADIKVESPVSQKGGATRGRSSLGHEDVDEESLRLIKELQANDMGLRRRSGRA